MSTAFDALASAIESQNRRRFWYAARWTVFVVVVSCYPIAHLILWGFRGFVVGR